MFTIIQVKDTNENIWYCNLGAFRCAEPIPDATYCVVHFGEIGIRYPGTTKDFSDYLQSQLRTLMLAQQKPY